MKPALHAKLRQDFITKKNHFNMFKRQKLTIQNARHNSTNIKTSRIGT